MSATPRKTTVGDTLRSFAKGTGLTSGPLPAGLIAGGAGALAGLVAAPAIKYLYPEVSHMSNARLGLLGAAAVGIPAAGLAYTLSRAKNRNGYYRPKVAYYSPGGLPPNKSMYGERVDSNQIHRDYLMRQAEPRPQRSHAPAVPAPAQSGFLGAIGSYLDPRKRVGYALTGIAAQGVANRLGMSNKLNNMLRMPVGQAVRSVLPALGALSSFGRK